VESDPTERHADGRRAGHRAARYLAPVALIAVAVATIALAAGGGGGSSTATTSTTAPAPNKSRHRFWIVRAGQSLSLISARTGVPQAQIRQLNPGQDLGALRLRQKVRVRP